MKSTLLALAAALVAAPAWAANPEPTQMTADQVVGYAQWMYPGQVLAVRYDRSAAENPHYHVDMLLISGKVAKFEVDAVNGRFALVAPAQEQPRLPMTLASAVARVKQKIDGEVVSAEFDGSTRGDPHYHVDVRLPTGHVIPVRVEKDGVLQWREAVARP